MRGLKISSLHPEYLMSPGYEEIEITHRCTVCIFLPSIQFIVSSERYTFFESSLRVGSPTDDISAKLKSGPL